MAKEAQGEGNEEPDRSREDEKEEAWMLSHLTWFRNEWTAIWSDSFGDVEKRTAVPPMQFNKEPVPSHAKLFPALQIFSVRVTELKGKLCWPIDVFGLIAVRDSVDQNRNYIFERRRDNCQTLTAKDSSLVLTGPSRAVLLCDPIDFEVELRVKGAKPSEDKVLSAAVFAYNCITMEGRAGSLQRYMEQGLRCTLEFRYAHLHMALEAEIKVWVAEGSTEFCGKFIARTASIDENVTLLDTQDGTVPISGDGFIIFSRSVVVVEGLDGHEKLIVGVQARRNGEDENRGVCKEVTFIPARSGESHDTLDVGFCKMSAVVSWSLVF
uniref:Uncharacterized protein n=1 Tax=Avena sativa TaxID=4498 RepID=A0ACD5Y6C0_AVESA